jgi:hypothetical protein
MTNEAPNAFSPVPDEPSDGGEHAIPVMLILASSLVMLVIFGFTHIDDINYIHHVTGESASAQAGALLGNLAAWFFLALIIGGLASLAAKPPRRMKLFATVFAVAGILISLGSVAIDYLRQRSYRSQQQAKAQQMADFAKEYAAAHPVNGAFTTLPGSDVSALTRDFFSQVNRLRNKHNQDSAQYAGALGKLYTAESFSSLATMRQSMQAADGIRKIDQDYGDAFGKSLNELKNRVQASSLSARDKEKLMQGIGSAMPASWKAQQKAEGKWAEATHAFYEFALEQSSSIKAENGHVQISSDAVRQEFNSRMHECADLRNRFLEATRTMALKPQASMKNPGVTSSDPSLK